MFCQRKFRLSATDFKEIRWIPLQQLPLIQIYVRDHYSHSILLSRKQQETQQFMSMSMAFNISCLLSFCIQTHYEEEKWKKKFFLVH